MSLAILTYWVNRQYRLAEEIDLMFFTPEEQK